MTDPRHQPTWRAILLTEAVLALALRLAVLARPFSAIDRIFVPDDTYYTLSIARSLAHGHGPTADGQTLTSGFQPLVAFLMTPVFWLTSNLEVAVRADLTLLVLCDVAIVILIAELGRRLAGPVAGAVAGGIWAASPAAVRLALGGLETTLAMSLELGVLLTWAWTTDRAGRRRGAALGAVAGLAVLGRIDALALVGLIAAVELWRRHWRVLVAAGVAFVVVVGPWWAYCVLRFSSVVPGSGSAAHALQPGAPWNALTTSVAGAVLVNGPFAVWSQIEGQFGDRSITAPYWISIGLFVVIATAALFRSSFARSSAQRAHAAVLGVAVTFALAITVFYGWFNVPYYLSRYLGPVVMVETLLIGCGAAWLVGRVSRGRHQNVEREPRVLSPIRWSVATGVAVLLAMVVLARPLGAGETVSLAGARYESATGYRPQVLAALKRIPPGAVIGAAQSGTLSFFAVDRTVVNLDGVVDPQAAQARRDGRLGEYVVRRNVEWVVDWTLNVASITAEAERADPSWRFVTVAVLRAPGRPDVSVARRVAGS